MPEPTSVSSPSNVDSSKNVPKRQIFLFVSLCVVLAGGFLFYNLTNLSRKQLFPLPSSPFSPKPSFPGSFSLKQFNTDQEFQTYVQDNQVTGFGGNFSVDSMVAPTALALPTAERAIGAGAPSIPDRFSETNVQVAGIDEPDIIKTNGQQFFISSDRQYFDIGRPIPMDMSTMKSGEGVTGSAGSAGSPVNEIMPVAPDAAVMRIAPGYIPPQMEQPLTQILTAYPPAQLAKLAKIDTNGELLLADKTLIVQGQANGQGVITGFDVSVPAKPVQKWQIKLQQNNQLVTSRLKDGKFYAITQNYFYSNAPCPYIPLLQTNGQELRIPCTDIYYPDHDINGVDKTLTAMIIDPVTGEITKSTSVVGSSQGNTVYMSPDSIYLTYQTQTETMDLLYGFMSEDGGGIFPAAVKEKLAKLRDYDISRQAKSVELQTIIESYQRNLTQDDRLKLENDLRNAMKDYLQKHNRELEQTLIVKLSADDLSTQATGGVPGYLLNQFSLDEYQGNLRAATTFGQTWTQFGQSETASDVYVLDSDLHQKGVVTDLGKDERIYSVRFLADKGYVVTFKQTDPFYVLNLANPSNPQKTGELKIPGYSSYLHPIGTNLVVGIGKENSNLKVSLFDVTDPANPKEASKYTLDEYWSEILSTHHAFLLDEKHQVFFMPGMKGGYIFSYANNQLKLVKAVSQDQVQRAFFINDNLYIIGNTKITVLNETNWQVVNELDL